MPQHTGVLAASILLVVCMGMNLVGFPEVWKMLRSDKESVAAVPSTPKPTESKTVYAPPASQPVAVPKPTPKPPKPEPVKEPPKETKPPAPAPVPAPVKKVETPAPQPVPIPASKQADPPKKQEPEPKKVEPTPQPTPVKQPEPKKESSENRTQAFAPIIPQHLADKKEAPFPSDPTAPVAKTPPPSSTVKEPALSIPSSAYASAFVPEKVAPKKTSNEPLYETIDSALQRPVIYESHPTLNQRIEHSVQSATVQAAAPKPLPAPDAAANPKFKSLAPLKRLPPTE